jgi:hypothetical protein
MKIISFQNQIIFNLTSRSADKLKLINSKFNNLTYLNKISIGSEQSQTSVSTKTEANSQHFESALMCQDRLLRLTEY